jgi:hypothetical protein
MGSILIRKVPDGVHRKFKQACRDRKVSMEEAIVRLLAREVGEGRRGRPRTTGAKRRAASAKRGGKKGAKKSLKKSPRTTTRKAARRPARTARGSASARTSKTKA